MSARRPLILLIALILSGVIAYLNSIALAHNYYWVYWWYDVVMHFLTGFTLGLFIYWGFFASGVFGKKTRSTKQIFWAVFIAILAIGVAWEVMEYMNGITQAIEGYARDTANDLIFDCTGAMLATLFLTRNHG